MSDTKLLLKAAVFAAEKHRDQRRDGPEKIPYINHPLGVANNIVTIGEVNDVAVLQAALLHDTVEDTSTTLAELEDIFGAEVMSLVRDVTDDKSLPAYQRKLDQISHSPHIAHKAKIVKLSDKLYNLRDLLSSPLESWGAERIQGYFVWSWFVVKGLRGTNVQLEAELDRVFASDFVLNGVKYACIPVPLTDDVQMQARLDAFIALKRGATC